MIKMSMIGRFASEPATREVGNGRSVCCFSFAADTGVKDASGNKVSNFFNASAWGKTGENIQKFFHKGDAVLLYGKFCARPYQGTDGSQKTSMDVNVDDYEFVPGGRKESAPKAEDDEKQQTHRRRRQAQQEYEAEPASSDDDELPF